MKSSDKTWSPEGGNGNPLQYSCLENPLDSMKRQKDIIPEDEPPGWKVSKYATGEECRAIINGSRKNEATGPKWKRCSVVDMSGGESKAQCCQEQKHSRKGRRGEETPVHTSYQIPRIILTGLHPG